MRATRAGGAGVRVRAGSENGGADERASEWGAKASASRGVEAAAAKPRAAAASLEFGVVDEAHRSQTHLSILLGDGKIAFKHHSTGGAEARTRGVAVARAMDEMRARMRDRRLERRARDARDAPPPPPDARGQDPSSAGPSSNHDDVDETATDAYDAALRGLEADRRALREEVLRVRRVDRDREEAARSERAKRLELERELARLREDAASAGPGGAAAAAAAVEETRAQMRATLAAVDAAARERDEAAREIQTELGVLQMERMKLKAVAERSADSRGGASAVGPSSECSADPAPKRAASADPKPADTTASGSALETAAARLAVEAELRGDLEAVAARLAEACAEADETDRAARREMAEMAEAARRAARRAAEAETEALRHGARAEDAEATCATLQERVRRAELRMEEAFATRNAASDDVSGKGLRETPPKTEKGADAGGSGASSGAELASLREDLARETSLAKSALREADEANRAREEAARRLAERERELAAASAATRDAEAASSALLTEAKEATSRESASLRAELSDCQAAFASLRAQLADALADLDGVSREKKSLAEEAARKAREAREAREEAEEAARALAEEREAFRLRWKAARAEAEERESAHRLEKATWEDTARMARRERYAAASGTDLRTGTAAREAERETVGADGEGRTSGGEAERATAAAALAAETSPSAPGRTIFRHALSNGDDDVVPASTRVGGSASFSRDTDLASLVDSRVSDESPTLAKATRKRNAFAPNGFPLPEADPAPISFAPASDRVPVPVPVPGRSEYDRYLDALPPSPIAGPPPPPPPGRARGRGDAGDEPARRVWRERPVPPP